MYRDFTFLCVIPARGGSKGVPQKNIRRLGGQPLLTYSIDAALKTPELDQVVVSTDDDEIARVAKENGADIIMRPVDLANSEALIEPTLIHALDSITPAQVFDYVVLLEPTSPFRTSQSISACIQKIVDEKGRSLVTVVETHDSLGFVQSNRFRLLDPSAPRRRQDRRSLFKECGVAYVCSVEYLRKTGRLEAEEWVAYVVDPSESFDINTMSDLQYAEFLMQAKGIKNAEDY